MAEDDELKAEYEQFAPVLGITLLSSSIAFFGVSLLIVKTCRLPDAVEKGQTWRWTNLCVSLMHAAIVAVWDILCVIRYPEFVYDMLHYQNMLMYTMATFSTGYFAYELIDLIVTRRYAQDWPITLHHIAATSTFTYHIVNNLCIGYTTMALMAEINSVFLHSRKLLQMNKVSFDHWLYRLVTSLNILTFLFFRLIPISVIIIDLYRFGYKLSKLYYWLLTVSVIAQTPISLTLFWRLVKNDVIKPILNKKTA